MSRFIGGIEIPGSAVLAEATRRLQETTNEFTYHHSRRAFLFSELHAEKLGLKPDPELLYLAAIFHDAGLLTPFSDVEQRFEVDSADHARKFMLERGFAAEAADTVWTAIALHSTPGIPGHMGPEIATLNLGVLTDLFGVGLDQLDGDRIKEIVDAHPRGDFADDFLSLMVDGLKSRPATTRGTVWSDVLEHFVPGFRRASIVDLIGASAWQR